MARSPVSWFAEEGSITIGGIRYSTRVRDINVTGGGRDVELIRTFGAGTVPNERPMEMVEGRITYVSDIPVQTAQWVYGGSYAVGTGASMVSGGDLTRYRMSVGGVRYDWRDPTDLSGPAIRITLGSAWGTAIEWSNSTDNALEETITFKALPADVKIQRTTNAADNPLPAP